MNNSTIEQANRSDVKIFLLDALLKVLSTDKYAEFSFMIDNLQSKLRSAFYISFSKAVRTFGKDKLIYTTDQLTKAKEIRAGWNPPPTVDRAIRLLILLEIPYENDKVYFNMLEDLFGSGDVGELVALYASLPIIPYPQQLIARCKEGCRSNIGEVFEVVANGNPFPADFLDEDGFNQMVLKCLFVGKPIYLVTNLQQRLNKNLSRMAVDYAHERWAAQRPVNPELWQLVSPFLEPENLKDIQRLNLSDDDLEKQAATLVCFKNHLKEAEEIYKFSKYAAKVESEELNWHSLGVSYWSASH